MIVANMAVSDVNLGRIKGIDNSSFQLNVVFLDSLYNQKGSVAAVLDLVANTTLYESTLGIIGEDYSSNTEGLSLVAEFYELPVCGWGSTSTDLSDHSTYITFFRTIYTDFYQGVALVKFIRSMGWSQVALLVRGDSYGLALSESFRAAASIFDVSIKTSVSISTRYYW